MCAILTASFTCLIAAAAGAQIARDTTREARGTQQTNAVAITPAPSPTPARTPPPTTFAELAAWPHDKLGELDIALVNLLCAEGLPGFEGLDVAKVLKTLDLWALAVKGETERLQPKFKATPAYYDNSEVCFRMVVLCLVLQNDLGVHYNTERVSNPDFSNSKDQFIHGMVNSSNGGTCVSMPVLYVAVGRRLGYPLKLVLGREHVFCRWDDGKGTVKNFEGASKGLSSYPDEYYRTWPRPISDEDLKNREFLVSLTPAEELSVFLAARGHCFTDQRRFKEARGAYVAAAQTFPSATAYPYFIRQTDLVLSPPRRPQPGTPPNPWGMPPTPMPPDPHRRRR